MREKETYATLASTQQIIPEYLEIIRELMVWDAKCLISSPLRKDDVGSYVLVNQIPSPLHWSRQMEWPWAVLEAELEPHHVCLDIGGSWAVMKYPIAERCDWLYSIEVDPEIINKTQESIDKLGFHGKILQDLADVRCLPDAFTETFDRVFCISVLEHVPDNHIKAIDEMLRVLKPGGILLMTLDIRLSGDWPDFNIDVPKANEILTHLGIDDVNNGLETGAELAGKAVICCMMIRYVKPKV